MGVVDGGASRHQSRILGPNHPQIRCRLKYVNKAQDQAVFSSNDWATLNPLSEKDINPHPQDLEALLVLGIELSQFSQGVLEHAEFGVSLRDANYLLEGHRP